MQRHVKFLGQFLRNPKKVGAIAPSSPALARVITSWVNLEEADAVVEIGPGDGAFTPYIQRRLKPGAVFFAIEIEEKMCARLRERYPGLTVYCGCASQASEFLRQHGVDKADCIVSGLPWTLFSPRLQKTLLDATINALRPGGQFVTFAYLPGLLMRSGQLFRRRLKRSFSSVTQSRVVWRNLPPAFVYQCVK